jgi:hypothetical protein
LKTSASYYDSARLIWKIIEHRLELHYFALIDWSTPIFNFYYVFVFDIANLKFPKDVDLMTSPVPLHVNIVLYLHIRNDVLVNDGLKQLLG